MFGEYSQASRTEMTWNQKRQAGKGLSIIQIDNEAQGGGSPHAQSLASEKRATAKAKYLGPSS